MQKDTLCLGLLSLGPRSGYEIKQMFEGPLSDFYSLSFGTIYPTLNKLQSEKYVSYKKGCFRGQEIIARLKYLGKTTKRAVVFPGSINSISNGSGRKIGKKIFHTKNEDNHQTHFSVEKSEYYVNDMRITPIANQWDLIQD